MSVHKSLFNVFNCTGDRITKLGFGNHEEIEEINLIQIKGRLYDPLICRFLSPDNFIEDNLNSQAYNRYSYVINNPLKFKDPSGRFFGAIFSAISRIVSNVFRTLSSPRGLLAVAATIITGGIVAAAAPALLAGMGIAATTTTSSVLTGVFAGAASGFVGGTIATGSVDKGLQNALLGAIGGAFGGFANKIGGDLMKATNNRISFSNPNPFLASETVRIGTQATLNGISNNLAGERFDDGFLDGFLIGVAGSSYKMITGYNPKWGPGQNPKTPLSPNALCPEMQNCIGNRLQNPSDKIGFADEGGPLSQSANFIPGIRAVAALHDNLLLYTEKNDFINYGSMLPAAGWTYFSLLDQYGLYRIM